MCPCCLLLCAERRCCPRCRCAQEPAREEGRPEGISHCSSVPFACCSGTAAAAAAILLAVTAAASHFELYAHVCGLALVTVDGSSICRLYWGTGCGKGLQKVIRSLNSSRSQLPIPYTLQSTARKTTNEMNRLHIISFDRNPNHRYWSRNGSLKRRFRNHLEVYAPD